MPGFVRIIGGTWRGRRLKVADVAGLRPTPDRVRETIFNWLASFIDGAHCLDAFAGTGAFGFEALSRGAASVVMVDNNPEVVKQLIATRDTLQAHEADIYCARIPNGLRPSPKAFNIVFLDPPYTGNFLFPTCEFLEKEGFLAANAYIYLEAKEVIKDNELPSNWRILKAKQAGSVYYHLAQRT